MTTASTLSKYASSTGLRKFLESQGFKFVKPLVFVRERKGMFDILHFSIRNGGWSLKPIVQCWVPEIDPDFNVTKFPKSLPPGITTGGFLNPFGEIGFLGGGAWSIREENNIPNVLKEVKALVETVALPWFESISNRSVLIDKLIREIKDSDDFVGIKERILAAEK